MSDYTISYSRKEKLEQEEVVLDKEVDKAKVIERFNEDFGRVYVGELTEEDAKKYMGITAVVTMYYDSSDKLRDGLSMTRSVEYSIDRW